MDASNCRGYPPNSVSSEEINYEPYKLPLKPIPEGEGVGFYGAVATSKDGEIIQCLVCGWWYQSLSFHIWKAHEVKGKEYQERYGLRLGGGVISPKVRQNIQDKFLERKNANYHLAEARKKMLENNAKRKRGELPPLEKGNRGKRSAEYDNEMGNCPEQTLNKIRALAEKNGGVIKQTDYCVQYGSMYHVNRHFGNWKNAVKLAGVTMAQDKFNSDNREKYIKQVQDYYKKHGRTPLYSDYRDNKDLPTPSTIEYTWGTLNEFRKEAGVPTIERINKKWTVVLPQKG